MYSGNPTPIHSQGYYEGGMESEIERNIVEDLDLDDKYCDASIFTSKDVYLMD
jgi:hypothetical protein